MEDHIAERKYLETGSRQGPKPEGPKPGPVPYSVPGLVHAGLPRAGETRPPHLSWERHQRKNTTQPQSLLSCAGGGSHVTRHESSKRSGARVSRRASPTLEGNADASVEPQKRERMVVRAFLRCAGVEFGDEEISERRERPVDSLSERRGFRSWTLLVSASAACSGNSGNSATIRRTASATY